MGCDIEIFGIQPDLKMQERCIRFCEALSAKAPLPPSKYEVPAKWPPPRPEDENPACAMLVNPSEGLAKKSGTANKSIFDSEISEEMQRLFADIWEREEREEEEQFRRHQEEIRGRVEPPDVVSRYSNIIFVGAPIDREIIKNYPGKSKWTPTSFSELFSLPFTGLWCKFDNEKGGLICSPYPQASCNVPDEGFETRNGHQYWLASSYRTSAGNSHPYVVAHAIKRHFIPNLIFNADYDQELFDWIIRDIGLEEKIDQANDLDLMDVVYDGLIDTRDTYLAWTIKRKIWDSQK